MTQTRCAAARSTRACQRSVSSSTPLLIASWSILPSCAGIWHRIGQCDVPVNAAKSNPAMRERSIRLEIHRHAVDAVAQSGGRRAVREDMAQVTAAAAAVAFGAHHAVRAVARFLDRTGLRIVEARPAGAALEFLLRLEQFLPAARAGEGPGALLVIKGATSRPLGAVLAHDVELLRVKDLAPLGLGAGDGIGLHIHVRLLSSPAIYSLRLDVAFLHDTSPLHDFVFDVLGKLLGAH